MIFTTRKRSVGQGNIFTGVCQLFCPEMCCGERSVVKEGCGRHSPPSPGPRRRPPPLDSEADTPLPVETATGAGGTHPTGMHSCVL